MVLKPLGRSRPRERKHLFKVTEKVTGITRVSRVHFSVLNKTLIYHARNEAEEMKVQMAHPKKKKKSEEKA